MKRKTDQFLMPEVKNLQSKDSNFDLYPSHDLGAEMIFRGYDGLVDYIATKRTVCLEGFVGVDWNLMMLKISFALESKGITFCLINMSECLKPEHEILKLTKPFLGEEESVWGTKCDLELRDFFDSEKINALEVKEDVDVRIVFGSGASLVSFAHTLCLLYTSPSPRD